MRTLWPLLFLFSCVTVCSPQQGPPMDTYTGNWLLVSCQITVKEFDHNTHGEDETRAEAYRDGICRGLVNGVSDASPEVCPTNGVTLEQSVRVVVKYLQDHPEELNLKNTTLIEKALAKAFPCH